MSRPYDGFDIHLDHPAGLQRQVFEQVRGAILKGHVARGSRLPSSRALAHLAGVSRATVVLAYEQLKAEGYLESREGAGSFVSRSIPEFSIMTRSGRRKSTVPVAARPKFSQQAEQLRALGGEPQRELLPNGQFAAFPLGVPALDVFPFKIWMQLQRRHLRRLHGRWLGYASPQGYAPLRRAIADHLALGRGISCSEDQILIVNGSQQSLTLVAQALLEPGDAVLMEDPGYLGARGAFLTSRAKLIPVPVDKEGLQIDSSLLAPKARLAYVTPSHQFPLGYTMSQARRGALLDWARESDAYIFEDDYDSEFRYLGRPLQPLFALDASKRVIYSGTFTKVLFPSLRLGYLVVPQPLVSTLVALRRFFDVHSPVLDQAVLADFITEGHFARHVRRMRKLYSQRLDFMTGHFAKIFRGSTLRVQTAKAGMHALVWLDEGARDEEIARRSAIAGLQVAPLSPLYLRSSKPGLLLGYGCTDEPRIRWGLAELRKQINLPA